MQQIGEALLTSAGMLWKAVWALIFGYIISAAIQVLISRQQMADALGQRGFKEASLAAFFSISSSCSFAALAASPLRTGEGRPSRQRPRFPHFLDQSGASARYCALGALVGWKFTLGNILLGLLMLIYAYALTSLWMPMRLADKAKRHAEEAQKAEDHGMQGRFKDKLFSCTSASTLRSPVHAGMRSRG